MVTTSPLFPEAIPYLQLAEELVHQPHAEDILLSTVGQFPALSHALLNYLAQQAENIALNRPAHSWFLMVVADAAAQQTDDLLLQALTAWRQAWAANAWVQPARATAASTRARSLFAQLQEPGWLAACDWQRNALPWTRPNFTQAATELEQALYQLEQTGLSTFIPDCQLALAYAYLLIGRFEEAAAQTAVAEKTFQERNDRLGLARCLYTKASYLRRQTYFEAAVDCFGEALNHFQEVGASVQVTMTTMQLGLISWWWQHDIQTAEAKLKWAVKQFEILALPLWSAQCHFGLGQIYQQTGQLAAADKALHAAREIFARFHLAGLWADVLLDSGWLALYKGQHQSGLDYFRQAESLYAQIGNRWLPVVATMHQGEAYTQMGLYQRALHCLEQAHGQLVELAMPQRIAACEMRLAQVYLQLSQWRQAHIYLDEAEVHYQQGGQIDAYPIVYNLRAELLFYEGKEQEAITSLQRALSAAQQQGDRMQIAQAQRLLGQALCASNRLIEAYDHLQQANASLTDMGMLVEQAACQINLGNYYAQANDSVSARDAWERTLALIQEGMPELAWQAYAGLARLAEVEGDAVPALVHYRQAIAAMARLRRALWQPAVAGSYLTRPLPVFDRAISLVIHKNLNEDALFFIEESKAQTVARQLVTSGKANLSLPPQITELISEIRWLQTKVKGSREPGLAGFSTVKELHQQFLQKVRQYDAAISQAERTHWSDSDFDMAGGSFSLDQFRERASTFLGEKWLALDYYQTGEWINVAVISPTGCYLWQTHLTAAVRFALDTCTKVGYGRTLSLRDLVVLGNALLPDFVCENLNPETYLLIAPHQQLHRVPWAALHTGKPGYPLVMACIPAIVPSLQNLVLLWQRPQAVPTTWNRAGLLVAVSDFQGRHPPLAAVKYETKQLIALFGSGSESLIEEDATFTNWLQLGQANGLSRFRFLHMATHAFSDQFSGRLSGLALYDRDLWLDELQQMGPLPPLVVLSACSSLRNLVYEGDELMGLTIGCLAAGAQRIVGSLWPVLDQKSPDFMVNFYRRLLSGKEAAEALALAQRTAVNTGVDLMHWSSFQCVGQP
ncbi:MAG: CHAT domain-containing protein [Anaerolineae bacterium]|nr:CHAT domain-containing protein [Anaerolineae bacterium]